jgi:cytochrome P450
LAGYERGGDPEGPVDFETYRRLRQVGPIASIRLGEWFAGRYEALTEVLRDVESFRADLSMFGTPEIPEEQLFLSEIPEPRHGEVRRVYNAYFGPHRVARFAPFVESYCHQLVDKLVAEQPAELVAGYTKRIPSDVIAHVIGVPLEDGSLFTAWAEEGVMQMRPADVVTAGKSGEHPLHAYVARLVEDRRGGLRDGGGARRERRADDVVGGLLQADVQAAPLTPTEVCTQVQFIVGSAVETTRKLLANMFLMLLRRPDLYTAIRGNPDLVPATVEETLRFYSPVQSTVRRCVHDTEVAGTPVRKGELVQAAIGSANRDVAAFTDADDIRLDRQSQRSHVGFGAGPHVCPGAALARLEATVALKVFTQRIAAISPVDRHDYGPLPSVGIHSPAVMPAQLTPA